MTFGSEWYRLDDRGEPVPIGGIEDYIAYTGLGEAFPAKGLWGHPKQIVARSNVGNYRISTVFLFLDHNWGPGGPPVLWETMAFRHDKGKAHRENEKTRAKLGIPPRPASDWDNYTGEEYFRCSGSREQAEAQHLRVCKKMARREKIPVANLVLEIPA